MSHHIWWAYKSSHISVNHDLYFYVVIIFEQNSSVTIFTANAVSKLQSFKSRHDKLRWDKPASVFLKKYAIDECHIGRGGKNMKVKVFVEAEGRPMEAQSVVSHVSSMISKNLFRNTDHSL